MFCFGGFFSVFFFGGVGVVRQAEPVTQFELKTSFNYKMANVLFVCLFVYSRLSNFSAIRRLSPLPANVKFYKTKGTRKEYKQWKTRISLISIMQSDPPTKCNIKC
jgi:hypothetical protein